jgi:diguanylate cyclase (GGDEF)-like protein
VALLFLDLDGFKDVNDALGHDAGDAALVRVAAVIRDATARFGGAGALAARFGGDEFVVLLESGDVRAAATAIAEQLVQDLRRPLRLRTGQEASVTVSIGIALFPQDATDSAALLKSGDTAMYHAKVAGKNCWRFHDQSMRQGASRSAGQGMG